MTALEGVGNHLRMIVVKNVLKGVSAATQCAAFA